MTNVEILATGPEIIRDSTRATGPAIEELINRATKEIQIVAFVFTPIAFHILNLKRAAERGVKISIVINDLESHSAKVVSKLRNMAAGFPHVELYDFKDSRGRPLHAKIIISDRERAVVGSANLSLEGIYTNYEIGLLIEGEPVWKLAKVVDSLKLLSIRQ